MPETSSHLERAAHEIAAHHVIGAQPASYVQHLTQLPRLTQQLQDAHQHLVDASAHDLAHSSAAEWLLDNYYLVIEALRQIEEDLPETYYLQLPKLTAGASLSGSPSAGQPRIYAVASTFWTYEAYQLDQGRLSRFVAAYQQVSALTIGELWAVPTMLRLMLLETLARVAGQVARRTNDMSRMADSAIATDLSTGLNDNDIVANCILSLRRLNGQDWNRFFEGVSLVQQILSQDPARIYDQMDFASRDRYRGEIEILARATGLDETIVAQTAIDLSSAKENGAAP
ncbi:MAG: hypothetical protein WAU00_18670, partial [Caldilinea sp.]